MPSGFISWLLSNSDAKVRATAAANVAHYRADDYERQLLLNSERRPPHATNPRRKFENRLHLAAADRTSCSLQDDL